MGAPNRGIPGRPGYNPAPRRRRDAAAPVQAAEKEETAGMEQYFATECRAGPPSGWVRAPHRRSPLRQTWLAWRPHAFPFVSVVRHRPAAESAMTITAIRVVRADRNAMAHHSGSDSWVNQGLAARCFCQISLLLQTMTKHPRVRAAEMFGYKFLLASSLGIA
jgi:hypothetical protein